jgi:putative ABC transport system permease protein
MKREGEFFMFSISLKEMTFFKTRYLLIGFILFFVAALVFIINGLANGLAMDNASSIKKMDAVEFYIQKDAKNRLDRSQLSIDHKSDVFQNENIQPLAIQMSALKRTDKDSNLDITFMAVKPGSFLEPKITEGNELKNNGEYTLIVDEGLKAEGIKIGSALEDEKTGTVFKVSGFTNVQTFSHTPVAFMSLSTWEGLTRDITFNAIAMNNQNSHLRETVSNSVEDGIWVDKEAVISGIPGYEAEQNSLFMMLAFLIVIAVFVLAAFFYIMTIQKMNQFGILKAIGAKTSYLVKANLVQVTLLTVISISLAIGFTWGVLQLMPSDIPFMFDIVTLLQYSGILFIVSIFGSLFSSLNIMQADPIQAMGRVE